MKPGPKSTGAFTLVELMIVVAIVSLLAVIAIPNFVRARTTTQRNACINNLRQIYAVKQQWALEYKLGTSAEPSPAVVKTYLKNPLICPSGGIEATFDSSYIMGTVGARPSCKVLPSEHLLPSDTSE